MANLKTSALSKDEAIEMENALKRDEIKLNRHRALASCLSMISAQTLRICREGKPLHTFPDHALVIPRAGIDRAERPQCRRFGYRRRDRMLADIGLPQRIDKIGKPPLD